MVQGQGSAGIVIESQPYELEAFTDNGMVPVYYFSGRDAFSVRAYRYGDSVFVGTAYEKNIGALKSLVSYINVRRDIGSGKMPDMQRSVGIG